LPEQAAPTALSRRLVLILALACGVGVANVYFPQAITPLLAKDFQVSEGAAAFVATTAQLGYAIGIFFLVPLGDRLRRRLLIATMFAVVAIGLLLAGTASSLTLLYLFTAVVGAATVVPQVLIPMAADLAPTGQAGRVVGTLSGGLVGGILLARTFGGTLGQWLGWRAPYLIAGALAVLLTMVLLRVTPTTKSNTAHSYPALLATSARLFLSQPDLRRSGMYQAALFGGFSAAWTSVALFLTGPSYGYGTGVVGALAFVGAASVFCVPMAGRLIDRRGSDAVSVLCFAGALVAAAILLTGSLGGVAGLLGLAVGLLLLDVSMQSSQVANQARIFALLPSARSRLNSVYMTCAFLGGSLGSWLGARVYLDLGWNAVCGLLAAAALTALARHLIHQLRMARRTPAALPVAAPVATLAALPVAAPVATLAALPVAAPVATLAALPLAAPVIVPVATPVAAPDGASPADVKLSPIEDDTCSGGQI
jgi:predicted MFS family arabinose efflux permease